MKKTQFEILSNQLIEEVIKRDTVIDVKKASKIDLGVLVEVKNLTKKGIKQLIGMVYDITKDKSTVWVETADDIHVLKADDVEVLPLTPKQPKQGFNDHKTKLTESAVKDIFLMATTTDMSHKSIVSWVYLHYGIEIVPKTVSDIKLGKRWRRLNLVKGAC